MTLALKARNGVARSLITDTSVYNSISRLQRFEI